MISKIQKLTPQQFQHVCTTLYDISGIALTEGKEELVHSRLVRRLQANGINNYQEYFNFIKNDSTGKEMVLMLDSLTTNKTDFFREIQHFDFMTEKILPNLKSKRLRIWSSACSSGEEPYSIAMLLAEKIPDFSNWDIRILATDLSTDILTQAQKGIYTNKVIEPVPKPWQKKYLKAADPDKTTYQVIPQLRKLVNFARLNLMEEFPMKGPFDIIFCRNVMIYFDKPTQVKLIKKFCKLLPKDGHLLIGHAESLDHKNHDLTYIQPATYQK